MRRQTSSLFYGWRIVPFTVKTPLGDDTAYRLEVHQRPDGTILFQRNYATEKEAIDAAVEKIDDVSRKDMGGRLRLISNPRHKTGGGYAYICSKCNYSRSDVFPRKLCPSCGYKWREVPWEEFKKKTKPLPVGTKSSHLYGVHKHNPLPVSVDMSAKGQNKGEWLSYAADEVRFLVKKPHSEFAARDENPRNIKVWSKCWGDICADVMRYKDQFVGTWKYRWEIIDSRNNKVLDHGYTNTKSDAIGYASEYAPEYQRDLKYSPKANPASLSTDFASGDFHHVRIKPPNYQRYITKTFSEKQGIKAVMGIKQGRTEVQKLLFAKELWSIPEVKSWLQDHKYGKLKT